MAGWGRLTTAHIPSRPTGSFLEQGQELHLSRLGVAIQSICAGFAA